jgi:DNA-binding NarL/FixJ family response regulator
MQKKRIAIADDHKLLRETLKSLINSTEGMEVVGEAADGVSAIHMVKSVLPDLLLLDVSLPKLSGISVLNNLKEELPDVKIMMLTIYDSDDYISEFLKAGADGYCLKDAGWKELLAAIETVLAGRTYVSSTQSSPAE